MELDGTYFYVVVPNGAQAKETARTAAARAPAIFALAVSDESRNIMRNGSCSVPRMKGA